MSSEDGERPTLLTRNIPEKLRLSALEKSELRSFANNLSTQVAGARPFNCLLTNDRELRRLNKSFLGLDYPTDVLSFPQDTDHGHLGEIAISLERAHEQAQEQRHTTVDEICVLLLHGLLHLLGFDHESDRGEMALAERKWRRVFGLEQTLIGRRERTQNKRAG